MNRLLTIFAFLFSPVLTFSSSEFIDSAEMWWCASCSLAYPASQKTCLNKDCPLFRKKR